MGHSSSVTGDQLQATHIQMHVNTAPGANFFASIGDVCSFANLFLVTIINIFWTSDVVSAVCKVCSVEDGLVKGMIGDSELHCPAVRLYKKLNVKLSSSFCKDIKKNVSKGMEDTTKCSLANGDKYNYQKFLRQCRIGSYICHHVSQTLRGNFFRHVCDFAVSDFDFSLFGLTKENNYDVMYSISDFTLLDRLFFSEWDVFYDPLDPTAHFKYVQSIRFKAEPRRVSVTIHKAVCNKPFCKTYRQLAVQYAESVKSDSIAENTCH